MKKNGMISRLAILLIAAAVAVCGELVLDHFVYYHYEEEVLDTSTCALFPDQTPEYYNCEYTGGKLVQSAKDPQMVWTLTEDRALADMTIRFRKPLAQPCNIQVYFDADGNGFSEINSRTVTTSGRVMEVTIPLERKVYRALRVDIGGNVPLASISCDAFTIALHRVPGAFRLNVCLLMFTALACVMLLARMYLKNDGMRDAFNAYGAFLASDLIWALLISTATAIYFSLYYHVPGIHSAEDALRWILSPFWPVQIATFLILYGGMHLSRLRHFDLGGWLYRNRWRIGLFLFALCVMLDLNISSVHEWGGYLANPDNSGLVLGNSRLIRTDEWAKLIGITKALSYEHYPVFSNLIRATSTENVLIVGHIAWDISALFRPFTWGFLLFNSVSFGLSFQHFGQIIAFLLLAFDFFMLVCRNRKLSLAFACMVFFSPFVQWWTSFELLLDSFALLLLAHKYLTSESVKSKLLCAVGVIVFAGNFAMVMYPAWQVPIAYFLLAGLIWIIVSCHRNIRLRAKIDVPIIAGSILFVVACGAFIVLRSASAIHDMVNTVYPGTVRVSSPFPFNFINLNYLNMFSPYTEKYTVGPNLSEAANFFAFFPVGMAMCVYAMIRNRKADALAIIMMALSGFYALFSFVNVPDFLRKITFMYFSMSARIVSWFSFTQLILFFRGVALLKKGAKWHVSAAFSALFVAYVIYRIHGESIIAGQARLLAFIAAILFIIAFTGMRAGKDERAMRAFSSIMVFFALFTGGTVNPIQVGMPEIEKSLIVKEIEAIVAEDPSGKWLVEGLGFPYGMTPLLGGAPTINCVSNYPDLDMWYRLDPERDDEFAYNRYATQINANFTKDDTSFSVGGAADMTDLFLNVRDLEKTGASYILTNNLLETYSTREVSFTQLAAVPNFYIYRVTYSD